MCRWPLADDSGGVAKYEEFNRLMSLTNRGDNPVIIPELLAYVRAVYLEIVRVKYWQSIEGIFSYLPFLPIPPSLLISLPLSSRSLIMLALLR